MMPSLTNEQIEDRYFLWGKMEILNVLNDLIHRRETVTVYFNGGSDFIVTTLLEAGSDVLVFDLSGDAKANLRLPNSPSCVFVGHSNGIRVQFIGGQAHRFSWGGNDAFWINMPKRVVRLQRRESYRVLMPVAHPVMVRLFPGQDREPSEWAAHDLSVGGLGFTVTGHPDFEVGQDIPRLMLPLAEHGLINCSAVVRHVTHISDLVTGARYRVGVQFADLPAIAGVTIQRYIVKVEQQRRSIKGAYPR